RVGPRPHPAHGPDEVRHEAVARKPELPAVGARERRGKAEAFTGRVEQHLELRKRLQGALRDATSRSVTILVAGHYCHDTILGNGSVHRALGGTAAYAPAILDALGVPYEAVANVGTGLLYAAAVPREPV